MVLYNVWLAIRNPNVDDEEIWTTPFYNYTQLMVDICIELLEVVRRVYDILWKANDEDSSACFRLDKVSSDERSLFLVARGER